MFPVLEIDELPERREPIGSKAKFWFRRDGGLWLFKEARPGTGEDWAEKVSAELAALVGLPHAEVELARHGGTNGIVTLDFTGEHERGHLVHGNELLFEREPAYPKERRYRVHQHTLAAVRRVLEESSVVLPAGDWPANVIRPWDAFTGYLMLDALICNTDRHHQNWGLLVRTRGGRKVRELAPTFDHASSLGRELGDDERKHRLTTKDARGNLAAYVTRARSALYEEGGAALHPVAAFERAFAMSPEVGASWLARLGAVSDEACLNIVAKVPGPTMSDPARRFALALLQATRSRLETLRV